MENETKKITVEQVARICHEVNKAYCEAHGDNSQVPWGQAPEWQRNSAINGVVFVLENPTSTPRDTHESWLAEKRADGWKWGEVKDPVKREHPCFMPYEELPAEQKLKDVLFKATVESCRDEVDYVPENVQEAGA